MTENNTTVTCVELPSLKTFARYYEPIHAFLALTVCLFGIATNILNAIVLTRANMRNPTNALLTGIAMVDTVTMIAYGWDNVYMNLITAPNPTDYAHSRSMIYVILFQNVLVIGSHVISTALLVELAAFRCWTLHSGTHMRTKNHRHRTQSRSHKRMLTAGFVGAVLFGILMSLPTLFIYAVERQDGANSSTAIYRVDRPPPHYWFDIRPGAEPLESAQFILNGCLVKILASILIFVFTTCILVGMRIAQRRYLKLQNLSTTYANKTPTGVEYGATLLAVRDNPTTLCPGDGPIRTTEMNNRSHTNPRNMNRLAKKNRRSQKVTIMLIVVVASFVITEAPQGVVNTLVAVKGDCFRNAVYVPLGNFLDLAVLLNSSINFILYCTMSQMFRFNFTQLMIKLCPCACAKMNKPTPQACSNTTMGTTRMRIETARREQMKLSRHVAERAEHAIEVNFCAGEKITTS